MMRFKSITLVNPEVPYDVREWLYYPPFPLGLASISSFLRKHNIDVVIQDENIDRKINVETDLVGVSVFGRQKERAIKIIKDLKDQGKTVIVGGPDPTISPNEYKIADAVIRGDGEAGVLAFMRGQSIDQKFKSDINKLPVPDYTAIHPREYAEMFYEFLGYKWLVIVLSRGCPFNCAFCANNRIYGYWRKLSVKKAIEYIKAALSSTDIDGLGISDPTFAPDIKWGNSLCRSIISSGIKFEWSCYKNVNTISLSHLALMKKAGCILIHYGAESASDVILKSMNKRQNKRDIERAVSLTQSVGIIPRLSFIFGTPYETKETIDETVRFIEYLVRKYDCIVDPILYLPNPGTRFWDHFGPKISDKVDIDYIRSAIDYVLGLVVDKHGMSPNSKRIMFMRAFKYGASVYEEAKPKLL